MQRIVTVLLLFLCATSVMASPCPSVPEVQSILNRVLKFPVTVKSITYVKSFNACRLDTNSNDTFFLSRDGRLLIEGVLIKVPQLRISRREFEFFKSKSLFFTGKGRPLLVFTNPLCEACRENEKLLAKLKGRFKIYFIPLGFDGEEFKAAVASYCEKASGSKFFQLTPPFKLCNYGKLRVWSVEDKFKKLGITGTPVFITDNGTIIVGIDAFKRFLSQN